MKKLAVYSSLVLLTLCALYLIYVFRAVAIIFLLSLFTASAVRPLVLRLTQRGISIVPAIIITYTTGIVIIALALFAFGQIAIPELIDLSSKTVNRYQAAHQSWTSGTAFQQTLSGLLPPPQALLNSLATEEGTLLAQALLSTASSIASLLAAIAIILILSIYWTVDRLHFEGLWLSLLPASQRGRVRKLWNEVQDGVGDYIRSQSIQAFLAVILLAAGYTVMGINYPLLLAFVGAVAWFIPLVGYLFATAAALLVGFVNSPILGIIAAAFTITVFVALQLLVEEKWLKVRRDFSYLLVALLMIPLAETYGFFGLLAAPPLAVSLELLLRAIYDSRRDPLISDDPKTRLEELTRQLRDLQTRAADREDGLSPEMSSLIERLDGLMVRTTTALGEEQSASSPAGQ